MESLNINARLLMQTVVRHLKVLAAGAAWVLAAVPSAAITTNVSVVLERQITNGVRLLLMRESVTLVSDEELAKRKGKRWLETNYIKGKPYISEHSVAPPPLPRLLETFCVVCVEDNRTNVYRHRSLKKVVSTYNPEGRVLDVLNESRTTVYAHEHYGLSLQDGPHLAVTIVADEPTAGPETVEIENFLVWQSGESGLSLAGARLHGSYERGTLAVDIILWHPGRRSKTQTLRLVGHKWVPADEPAPPKADRGPSEQTAGHPQGD